MDGAIHVKVFGVHVPKGKSVPLRAEESDKTMETFQITQIALGENAGSKRSVVLINDGSNEWVIGSLIPGKCEQFQTDYMGRQSVTLRHTGDGEVWVSGFKTITSLDDFEEDDDEDDEEEDDEEEDGQGVSEVRGGWGRWCRIRCITHPTLQHRVDRRAEKVYRGHDSSKAHQSTNRRR